MKIQYNIIITNLIISLFTITSCQNNQRKPETKEDVMSLIILVNDNWQSKNPVHGNAFWHVAAYHTGNIAAFNTTGIDNYLNYSLDWANKNQWKGAKSNNPINWKYTYGETDEYVLFGDWQICFQTYIDLFNITGRSDSVMISRAMQVMGYQINTEENDYWWWADGLYMVMPVMTKLYHVTGNKQYLEKLSEYFDYSKNLMYDKENHLFYRDNKYIYPKHKSLNGKKDFWSRGNGWVFAGLAKVIQDLPDNYSPKNEFVNVFQEMAVSLKSSQQKGGYWTRSLIDPEHAPGSETSGTAFFTYGLLWGINNGILEKKEYWPTIRKSWNYLTQSAVNENGDVGYVQPIGERAIPGQIVDKNSTADFGVGAFLLAASEMYKAIEMQTE